MRLIIRELKKSIDKTALLNHASYSFSHGYVYGISGAEPSVKAFIDCISSEDTYEEGTVRIEADWKEHRIRFSDVMVIDDNPILPEYLTGMEFIKSFMDIHRDVVKDDKTPEEYLEEFGLDETASKVLIRNYTPVDREKLRLLNAYLLKPSVVIFYGITDKQAAEKVIAELRKDRIIIISTEDMEFAGKMCDELLTIENGVIKSRNGEEQKNA